MRYSATWPSLAEVLMQFDNMKRREFITLMPDVILASSTTNLIAVQEATSTVPVVFVQVSDPVAQGFVPNVTKPAVMFNPETSPQSKLFMRAIETAAPSLGVQPIAVAVRSTAEIEPALESFAGVPNGGLILPTDSFLLLRYQLIADLANRHRLPSIAAQVRFPHDGGLMSYSAEVNMIEQFRQAASYINRILTGEKPGDLPIQRADKYTFIINLKTAKALSLTVPLPLSGLADELIE
jgi:putative ABC transport system substrate-binding protein